MTNNHDTVFVHSMFCHNCNELMYCREKVEKCQDCGNKYEYKGKAPLDSFDRYTMMQ